jgi:DNA-binding LacI/PurR family transcriptional regulator
MQRLMEQSPDLDAVFVNSELMAIGAINAIQNSGKRAPEAIAVVGYDHLSIAIYNSLPLTTIRRNLPLVGKLLAQNLVAYTQTGVVTLVTTPAELVIRKSLKLRLTVLFEAACNRLQEGRALWHKFD